ncbi:MAG: ketohydroxyglutarate aldolase [Hyphococcus sp.]|nr:MAG: ketohydroxyglutarate aldolase [Marinicaulis sp.]
MTDEIKTPVIPIVQAEDAKTAVLTAKALQKGGLNMIEVVLRTDAALTCLEAISQELPDVIVGAGTVLNAGQADEVARRGAKFIVSPGLDDGVVNSAKANDLPIFPGVVTPSEVQRAANMGLSTVKFFPASLAGGVPMLKALSAVFRNMQFMPTGGVSEANLADYLALPSVVACGGSWLTPKDEIAAGNFGAVTKLAEEALQIASNTRS